MTVVGVYHVTGRRAYRGHRPGEQFHARLDANAERRALARGDISLIERVVPALPAEHRLPPGWADEHKVNEGSK